MGSARTLVRSGVILALMIAMAGCGEADGPGGRDPGPGTEPGTETPAGTPAQPGDPVIQIDESGGFTMPGHDFSTVPSVTVYADGRVITHGPQIMIWPPPALPNLQVSELGETDLEALVDAAGAAGLVGEVPEYGWPIIADAPTTTVTVTVDGRRYVHAANALGYGEENALPGGDTSLDAIALTEEEVQARLALLDFIATVQDAVDPFDGSEPYEITAFAIRAWPAVDLGGGLDGDVEIQVLDWPLELVLDSLDECAVVADDDAAALLTALAEANTLTQYMQDGVEYQVFFRPLLPHEGDCDAVG